MDTVITDGERMQVLRLACMRLEALWGVQPVLVYACIGDSDEHWQLWHPADRDGGSPSICVLLDGSTEPHPDGRLPTLAGW